MPTDSASSSAEPVGLIGLGLLGAALAERALSAGFAVYGYDVSAERGEQLRLLGGQPLESARAVGESCGTLLLALPDDDVSRRVLDKVSSVLAPGTIVLDATTGDAARMAHLGETLAQRGVTYLDATISGSSAQVRAGEALLMVGGGRDAFDRCASLFQAIARQAIHVGPCGSGAKMKLVTNLVLGLNRAALAEGLTLASVLDLDPTEALAVLRASMAYSQAMDAKGEKMTRGDFEPQARLSQHLKDVRLMLEAAQREGRRLPLSELHRELLELAEELGMGELDNSAVLRAIEHWSRR